jgi:hypothetical protein
VVASDESRRARFASTAFAGDDDDFCYRELSATNGPPLWPVTEMSNLILIVSFAGGRGPLRLSRRRNASWSSQPPLISVRHIARRRAVRALAGNIL